MENEVAEEATEPNQKRRDKRKKTTRREKECFHCGEVGHLAKLCPTKRATEERASGDDPDLVYVPPRRFKFDSEKDHAAFAQRVRAFKHQSRKSETCLQPTLSFGSRSEETLNCFIIRLQAALYKPMMEEVLAYLVWHHGSHRNLMVSPRDVRLAFRDKPLRGRAGELTFADTSAMSGYITFSTRALEAGLRDGCESGYEAEQPLVARYCNGKKEEHLFWLLLHEFTHLIGGFNNDRHDECFFDQVEEFAQEHLFLFSSHASSAE